MSTNPSGRSIWRASPVITVDSGGDHGQFLFSSVRTASAMTDGQVESAGTGEQAADSKTWCNFLLRSYKIHDIMLFLYVFYCLIAVLLCQIQRRTTP